MAEYIEREAAIKETCFNCSEKAICGGMCDDTDRLRAIPAADVRPVVLCRDCKHADFAGMGNGTVWCDKMERAMQEEGFCSYGADMREES